MHLADGVVASPGLLVALNATGAAAAALALRAGGGRRRSVAWTGTLAAFVLAAQNVNVPLVPGASAHVIGAGLLTLLVGPAQAVLALLAVLVVQALVLADGGVTVLGINALTIAVIPVLAVHLARRWLGAERLAWAAVLGTFAGNVGGALVLATTLVLGAGVPPSLAFGWLLGVQAMAGLIEGVLTALAVRQLAARAPALVALWPSARAGIPEPLDGARIPQIERRRGLAWAAVALGVVLVLLPFASRTPDALARVVDQVRAGP